MLKRYQILLASWQADYLKHLAEKYDVSFSESVRASICMAILCAVPKVYPEYIVPKLDEKISDASKKKNKGFDQVEMHRLLSNLYFEARKASEFTLAKETSEKHTKKIFS